MKNHEKIGCYVIQITDFEKSWSWSKQMQIIIFFSVCKVLLCFFLICHCVVKIKQIKDTKKWSDFQDINASPAVIVYSIIPSHCARLCEFYTTLSMVTVNTNSYVQNLTYLHKHRSLFIKMMLQKNAIILDAKFVAIENVGIHVY
jgi:hypothetical protein